MPEANISSTSAGDLAEDTEHVPERDPDEEAGHGSVSDDGTGRPPEAGGAEGPVIAEAGVPGAVDEDPPPREGLTPRQARRLRVAISSVVILAVVTVLAVRLDSAPSVLTVGYYGITLILSGIALFLSRRGRTRMATGVLLLSFASIVLAEWMLVSAR
jgi:hypothetical protein